MTVKDLLRPLPGVKRLSLLRQRLSFTGSAHYWERNYAHGGTSGDGSYGVLAQAKAEFLNAFVRENDLRSVTEFGCGDGHQLSLAEYPRYVGLDVSPAAIGLCKPLFAQDPTKSFFLYDGACFVDHAGLFTADLALSLDVVFRRRRPVHRDLRDEHADARHGSSCAASAFHALDRGKLSAMAAYAAKARPEFGARPG